MLITCFISWNVVFYQIKVTQPEHSVQVIECHQVNYVRLTVTAFIWNKVYHKPLKVNWAAFLEKFCDLTPFSSKEVSSKITSAISIVLQKFMNSKLE